MPAGDWLLRTLNDEGVNREKRRGGSGEGVRGPRPEISIDRMNGEA